MRKICIFLALVTLAFSCGDKEKEMSSAKDKDYVYFSEYATYIHLANDTLSQNHFSIGWDMGRHRLLTMAVSNTVYTVYRYQKVRNPVLNGMPINNFLCSPTRKTLNEMSAALSKMKEHWTLDSLSYIFLSTESIFDTGLEMSFMLSREKGIYQKNVEKAIRHTSLEKDINKVLKPYNLVVSRITTDWDYDPVSSTLDRYPLHELKLSLNTPMPKMFVIMPLRVELTTIHGKGPRHFRSYPSFDGIVA